MTRVGQLCENLDTAELFRVPELGAFILTELERDSDGASEILTCRTVDILEILNYFLTPYAETPVDSYDVVASKTVRLLACKTAIQILSKLVQDGGHEGSRITMRHESDLCLVLSELLLDSAINMEAGLCLDIFSLASKLILDFYIFDKQSFHSSLGRAGKGIPWMRGVFFKAFEAALSFSVSLNVCMQLIDCLGKEGHAFVVTLTSQILHNPSFNRKSKDLLIEKHQEAHLIHLVELHSSSKHSKLLSLLKGLSPRAEEYLKNEGIVHELMEFYCAAMHKFARNDDSRLITYSVPNSIKPLLSKIQNLVFSSFLSEDKSLLLYHEYYLLVTSILSVASSNESVDSILLLVSQMPTCQPIFKECRNIFQASILSLLERLLLGNFPKVNRSRQDDDKLNSLYIRINKEIIILCCKAKGIRKSIFSTALSKIEELTVSLTKKVLKDPLSWKLLTNLLDPLGESFGDRTARFSSFSRLPNINARNIQKEKELERQTPLLRELVDELIANITLCLFEYREGKRRRRAQTAKVMTDTSNTKDQRILVERFLASDLQFMYNLLVVIRQKLVNSSQGMIDAVKRLMLALNPFLGDVIENQRIIELIEERRSAIRAPPSNSIATRQFIRASIH